MACDCFEISYILGNTSVTETVSASGVYNGESYFTFTVEDTPLFLWSSPTDGSWFVTSQLGNTKEILAIWTSPICPIGTWSAITLFESFSVSEGDCLPSDSYILVSCDNDDFIFTNSDLSQYLGTTVKLEDMEGCWEVSALQSQDVVVTDSFKSCKWCLPKCEKPECR